MLVQHQHRHQTCKHASFLQAIEKLDAAIRDIKEAKNLGMLVTALAQRAAAREQLEQYTLSLADCQEILQLQSHNVKVSLQRRTHLLG